MNAVDTSPPPSSSSPNSSRRFTSIRLPIDEPVDDFGDAVQKLKTCSTTELRRARQHHRRALESLEQGGYSALSDSTRDRLVARLRRHLNALNQALDATPAPSDAAPDAENKSSVSSRVRTFLQALW